MKQDYTETPTEADFPLIDRCVVCDSVCAWQPRYETAMRTSEHFAMLSALRPLNYVPEYRVVKICADCTPDDNEALIHLIWIHYPEYAAVNPTQFGRRI